MTAAPPEYPVAGPVDSLELRWIVPGRLPAAVTGWFTRFPARAESRQDLYLVQPQLRGLSVKLRGGGVMDVKSYLGSPGNLGLPRPGRLESWRKWSFRYRPPGEAGAPRPGWVAVHKNRRSTWFPLQRGRDSAGVPPPAAQTGCAVEITEVHVHGEHWWSVGLEATGSAALVRRALQGAAGLVFAQPPPAFADLGLDNSWSYIQWLWQHHAAPT